MKNNNGMTDEERLEFGARIYAIEVVLAWLIADRMNDTGQQKEFIEALEADLDALRKEMISAPKMIELEQLVHRIKGSPLIRSALSQQGKAE